ncbi:hypothetical protein F5B21DRAFT_521725 [Xylaria acuta]|nr:hypothetical protein F5B21DRAFT_521725 [Xylaria acuta]
MPSHTHHQDRSMVTAKGKGREPAVATWPAPSDPNIVSPRKPTRRPKLSQSIFTQPRTTRHGSQTSNNIPLAEGSHHGGNHSSNTWTSSSENPDLPSEDGNDGREHFILEYNRLAQRHGIRPIVPGDFSPQAGHANALLDSRRGSWLSKMLRQGSENSEQTATKPDKASSRHQRRPSEVALNFAHGSKRGGLKNQDLRALVRFCGKSPLFLPTDYAPFSLTLPTCLRALAQALVQHIDTKGIFRVSGSSRVVNALYDYYCTDDNTEAISSTTRCPTLPSHIRCNAHDIASTFKRFLAGLPGGILGSLSLFDALVAIHSHLQGDPEWHWTKESKLRARLIALAIGTVKSQYQRELICAVFGLLCLVGRVAENTPREDDSGRPLPTGDLMGYNALGIIFGPLLIGDMINNYSMKVADPSAGLVLLPVSSPRSRKERHKHRRERRAGRKHAKRPTPSASSSFTVDKIHIANSITEMLIVHWREVVRQIRSTGSVRTRRSASNPQHSESVHMKILSSVSENFNFKNPPHWDHTRRRSVSPSTASLTATPRTGSTSTVNKQDNPLGQWTPHAQQASISSLGSTQKPSTKAPPHLLSPTIEESPSPQVKTPKLSRGRQKATDNVDSGLAQKTYPISPDTDSGRVHESSSEGRLTRPVMVGNELVAGVDNTIPGTFRSPARKPETLSPSPSPSVVEQNEIYIMPHSDTDLSGSGKTGDKTVIEATSSPSMKFDPPMSSSNSPTAQAAPRYEHDTGAPNLKNLHQTAMGDDRAEISQINLNNVVVDGAGQSHTEIGRTTVPGEISPLEPLLLHNSRRGDGPGNGGLPRSITDPRLGGKGRSTPTRLMGLGYTPSRVRNNTDYEAEALARSPADQWISLVASSKASTESLAKSAKERRLKRSVGNTSSRSSRESPSLAAPKLMSPERKQQSVQERGEPKRKLMALWPERKLLPEETPHSIHPTLRARVERFSPDKYSSDTPHRGSSRRSASKPVPGAVKAMAALFDNAGKESPDKSATVLSGRTRNSLRESRNFLYGDAIDGSPTKSNPPRVTRSPMKSPVRLGEDPYQRRTTKIPIPDKYSPTPKSPSTVRASPSHLTIEDTPMRPLRDTLRPIKTSLVSRKEPQSSPSKPTHETDHRNQPPKLGAMVPYQEEPPVGRFVRPSSATSAQSRDVSDDPPLERPDSRHTSGTSFLHAQIRGLQRQLEMKNEEIIHLRRQLETQEHMDIGTLCEQLRVTKRECLMWRKRAEAAERRVAVFQRFGSRFQAFTDGVDDDDGGKGIDELVGGASPACSVVRTEGSGEAFNNNRLRQRHGFMGKMRFGGADGAVFEDDGINDAHEVAAVRGGYKLRRSTSRRTAQLWETAQELMDFQHGSAMRV